MDLNTEEPNRHRFKDPVVKLERCDKIWKTLQLIRSLQDKHLEDLQDWIKREPVTPKKTMRKEPPMTFIPDKTLPLNLIGEPNLSKPYIKYQPIFNNGDESLPQFQLAEKSRVDLYHCEICSQEYCDYKRFTDHREIVHGIFNIPKKFLAKKEKVQNKINANLQDTRGYPSDNVSLQQVNTRLISDENIEAQETFVVRNTSPQNDSIRCELCGKCYKNIKRHMVDYHKIKYPELLNKVTDKNSNFHVNQSVLEFESPNYTPSEVLEKTVDETKEIPSQDVGLSAIENITNLSKRKLNMPSIGFCKRVRCIDSKEEESETGNERKLFKCKFCDRGYAFRGSLSRHIKTHKPCNKAMKFSQANRNEMRAESSVKLVKDRDNDDDNIDKKITKTRLSFTKELSQSDGFENPNANGNPIAVDGEEEKSLEIKCPCGRTFRTTSILANHKAGCKFLKDTDTPKSLETRTGVDKDSGISITIKKKNNSYEIVSKDGNDEEHLRNGYNTEEPEIFEESSDSSSENSDSSECDDQLENLVPEKSKYSETHRILKLEIAEEDVDVDIEDDMYDDNLEDNKNNVLSKNEHQVPLLRDLCKKLLIQRRIIAKEETTHKCRSCKIFLGSKERLSKHVERHKKLMKRSCSCGIKFYRMKAFDDHVAAVHPKCIACPYCKEKYKSIAALDEHLCPVTQGAQYTEIMNENYPCPNCKTYFGTTSLLDSHMKSKHLDPNLPFQCYKCLEKFPNETVRNLHLNQNHERGSACSVCNLKFQSVKSGQKHEAYHRGVGFPCHICKKTYRLKRYYLNHIKTVHSDFSNDKLECFICQKSMKTKSFRKHVLRHSSMIECEICHKVVYDFRTLEKHIMYCHGNENYPRKKCNACGASFSTKEQLEAHVMVEKSMKNKQSKQD